MTSCSSLVASTAGAALCCAVLLLLFPSFRVITCQNLQPLTLAILWRNTYSNDIIRDSQWLLEAKGVVARCQQVCLLFRADNCPFLIPCYLLFGPLHPRATDHTTIVAANYLHDWGYDHN